ncbi:MAG: hypothetical protein CL927_12790 [Deltaproteobacteria bacterium]|nr:hypothetical protein [Deltaproteobacteria bacterium]HCH63735.1 hypothetical protein [Deltaproteobacteria bacterium]
MTRLRQWWSAWLTVLGHREVGTGLAWFRMLVGVALLWEFTGPLVTDSVDLLWFTLEDGGYRASKGPGGWRWRPFGGYSPTAVYQMLAIGISAAIGTILGVGGRIAPLVGLQAFIALTRLNGSAGGGDDFLLSNMLWLLVLSNATATGSLTARWRTGRLWPDVSVPAWPRYLVIVQLVVMYTSTGLQKMSHHWVPWGDQSALWYILLQPSWQRWPLETMPDWAAPLTRAATVSTWMWELGAPVLLLAMWFRATARRSGRLRTVFQRMRVRTLYLAFGMLMHVGIFIVMDVGTFSLVSLAAYACAFHADEYRSITARLRGLATDAP